MKLSEFLLACSIIVAACLISVSCADEPQYRDRAQDPVTAFDFNGHSSNMFSAAEMRYAFEKFKPSKVSKWQKTFRNELKRITGVAIIEKQLQGYRPEVRKIDSEDIGFAIRQRWEIQTEPDVSVPFVLIVPKEIKDKAPLVITPHGHGKNTEQYAGIYVSEEDSLSAVDGERNMAYRFAKEEGFIAITPAARGFGKTREPKDVRNDNASSCRELMKRDALVGRTPTGDRVWDIMKILDWALENLPVDERNVILTGNSGGGTQTIYASAMDPRITISMPASAFSSFEASIGLQYHCECNYIPDIMNYCDMGDILGLVAPRPLCIIQGLHDGIFPIEGAREQFARTRKVYEAAGAPDNCELFEGPEGHRYYFGGADDFVRRHLVR